MSALPCTALPCPAHISLRQIPLPVHHELFTLSFYLSMSSISEMDLGSIIVDNHSNPTSTMMVECSGMPLLKHPPHWSFPRVMKSLCAFVGRRTASMCVAVMMKVGPGQPSKLTNPKPNLQNAETRAASRIFHELSTRSSRDMASAVYVRLHLPDGAEFDYALCIKTNCNSR